MGTEKTKRKVKVLIIEDNKEYAFMLKAFLSMSKRADFDVFHCLSLKEAMEKIPSENPDVILSDLSLPDSDSINTVKTVCAAAGTRPVIVLSGNNEDRISIDAVKYGAQDYVNKGECHENIELAILRAIERKKYETAIRDSREELAGVIAAAPVMMVVVDNNGSVVLTNPAAEATFNRAVKSENLRAFGSFIDCVNSPYVPGGCGCSPGCSECPVRRIIRETMEEDKNAYKKEVVYKVERSGAEEEITMAVSSTSIRLRGADYCMLLIDDITAQKNASLVVLREKENAEGYFELAGTAMVVLNEKAEIMNINRKGCELIGADAKEEVLGLNWIDNFIPESIRPQLKQVQDFIIEGGPGMPALYENEVLRKDGSVRAVEWRNRRISAPGGGFNTLSAGVDVTEKKAAEQTRKKALQATARQALEMEELLRQAKNVIRQSGDFKQTARLIIDSCLRMTGAKSGYAALLSPDGSENEVFFTESEGLPCVFDLNLPVPGSGLREIAYKNLSVVYENDFMKSEWVKFMPAGHAELKNVMFAPLVTDGAAVGVIGIANKTEDFSENDAGFVAQMGDLAALAFHNSKIEGMLKESEEKFRSMVNNTPGVFFRCGFDAGRTMIYLSDSVAAITGYEPEDFINNSKRSFWSIIHPEDSKSVRDEVEEKTKRGIAYSIEYRIIDASGRERWVNEKGQKIKLPDGGVFIDGFITDITLLKKNEETLKTDKLILETMNDSVFVFSPEGEINYFNNMAAEERGYSHEEFSSLRVTDIMSPAMKAKFKKTWEKIESAGAITYESEHMKKSGEKYPVEVKAKIIYRDGKKYALCILSDIGNRKKIEEEMVKAYQDLKELDRLKSNFVAIVSHELRTPVTVIKGFSSFILKGVAGPLAPKQKEFMETISSNSSRLEMIINDLIDVSKIEAGIMSVTKKACDFSKTVAGAVSDMRIIAARKNITLDPAVEDGITLNADAARMQQVVINLVNNAIKFSDAGSEITVGLSPVFKGKIPPEAGIMKLPAEKYACLSVRDRGIGIEKDHMKKVFERFYQIESADVRKHQGAGLGLSIAKSIIDMHEGHIWCESEGTGRGTVFYAIIPNE